MTFLKLYLVTLVGFLVLDALWLGLVAARFYKHHLGFLLRESPDWGAAAIFYLLFVTGIVVFVVWPSVEADSWSKALLLGALFGAVTYGAYDLTNQATVKNWPWLVTTVDVTWGAVLTASVSGLAFIVGRLWTSSS